jgi:hypothetical protein
MPTKSKAYAWTQAQESDVPLMKSGRPTTHKFAALLRYLESQYIAEYSDCCWRDCKTQSPNFRGEYTLKQDTELVKGDIEERSNCVSWFVQFICIVLIFLGLMHSECIIILCIFCIFKINTGNNSERGCYRLSKYC